MTIPFEDLDIGPYRPGEEQAVLDCVRSCFAFEPGIERWRQLYLSHPRGEPIIVAARDAFRIVSCVTELPCELRAFGGVKAASHGTDVMTLPEWRRRGLRTLLALEAAKIGRERKQAVVFSFANDMAYRGAVKYLHDVGMPKVLVRPLVRAVHGGLLVARRLLGLQACGRPEPAIPDSILAGPIPDRSEKPWTMRSLPYGWSTPTFDQRHSALFWNAEGLPPIACIRDSTYLKWRYTRVRSNPYLQQETTAAGSLGSSVIVRRATLDGIPLLFVMEWLWAEGRESDGRDLIKEAIRLARVVEAHGVAVLSRPGTLQYRVLRRCGFVSVPPFLFNKSVHFMVGCREATGDRARWIEPANWYLTWGDGLIL